MADGVTSAVGRATARRLFARLVRPQAGRIAALLAMAVGGTVLTTAVPWLVGIAVDTGIPRARMADYTPLVTLAVSITGCAIVSGSLTRRCGELAGRIGQNFVLTLRTTLFTNLGRQSVSFYERMSSGHLISLLTSDVDAVLGLFEVTFGGLLQAVLTIGVMIVAMFVLNVPLALVTLISLLPLYLLTTWQVTRLSPAFRRQRAGTADIASYLVESLHAIRVIQAFRRQTHNDEPFTERTERLRAADARILKLRGIFWPGLELILSLAALLVMVIGGLMVSSNDLRIGVLTTFILYAAQFFGPVATLPSALDALQSALAGMGRLADVLDAKPTVPEPTHPRRLGQRVRGEVSLDNVYFVYPRIINPETSPKSLGNLEIRALSLHLEAGQTVAMLGSTGAGKSTIAKLIARFYDPVAGQITLDGVDLRDIADHDLRRSITLLPQEGFLFSGSVADNIRIGRPSATRAEIEASARAVGADTVVRSLPDGYDTDIQARGARLSAGQRQLLAFARAFLIDPAVLILDEATSTLDIPTERDLRAALRVLLSGRTALIIAHRLSTVEIADRIVVVAEGSITDDGTASELLARCNVEFGALYRDGHGATGTRG
jgi:ATP-binding cassette subfamily B protein